MSKKGSLNYQFSQLMQSQKKFGHSKHEAKKTYRLEQEDKGNKWNSAKADGIFSKNTYSTYKQSAKSFVNWIKENNDELQIKTIEDIDKETCYIYLQHLQNDKNLRPTTVSTRMASLNKLLDLNLSKEEGNLEKRNFKDVFRSRESKEWDDRYQNQITIAKATGIRAMSVSSERGGDYAIKNSSFWRNVENARIYCSVIEKGGKFRNLEVLESYMKEVEDIVGQIQYRFKAPTKIEFKENYNRNSEPVLFKRYDKHIDNHSFRSEYSINLYQQFKSEKETRGEEIKSDYKGYDLECVLKVSKNLGHERPSIVIYSYFR